MSLCKFSIAANLGIWRRLLQTLMAANVFLIWKKIYRTAKSKTIARITVKQNKRSINKNRIYFCIVLSLPNFYWLFILKNSLADC